MWIFGSFPKDFMKIFFSGIMGIIFLQYVGQDNIKPWLYFLVFYLIDSGHVYSTFLRTLLSQQEIKTEPLTWQVPLFISVISVLWLYLKIPFFWHFVLYFELYHNLRQGWGIVRWYEKNNGKFYHNSWIYHSLTIIPPVAFHFRDIKFNVLGYSTTSDVPRYIGSQFEIFSLSFDNIYVFLFLCFFISIFLFWIIKELVNYFQIKVFEFNRISAMFYFISIYFYSFFLSETILQTLLLLILSHGIPYFFIMKKYLMNNNKSFLKTAISLIVLATIGSIVVYFMEEELLEGIFNYTVSNPLLIEYFLVLIYIVPTLSHFTWDMYLWKRRHPSNKGLYE